MHDAAIFVSIEARFRSNSELLQESATLSEAKRASQASRPICGQALGPDSNAAFPRNQHLLQLAHQQVEQIRNNANYDDAHDHDVGAQKIRGA